MIWKKIDTRFCIYLPCTLYIGLSLNNFIGNLKINLIFLEKQFKSQLEIYYTNIVCCSNYLTYILYYNLNNWISIYDNYNILHTNFWHNTLSVFIMLYKYIHFMHSLHGKWISGGEYPLSFCKAGFVFFPEYFCHLCISHIKIKSDNIFITFKQTLTECIHIRHQGCLYKEQ